MQLTEQFILLQAPNAAAAENGRKLSKKGSFSDLRKTQDDSLYWADCAGSGKIPTTPPLTGPIPTRRFAAAPAQADSFPASMLWA